MPLLAITNLTPNRQLFQDPSGLSSWSISVAGGTTRSNIKLSQVQFAALEAILEAAVANARIRYAISDDPSTLADDPRYNTRIATQSPITVDVHDKVIVSKLTVPGPVRIVLPDVLPTGFLFDIIDGTGDASQNSITVVPEPPATINGLASLDLITDFINVPLNKTSTGTWVCGSANSGSGLSPFQAISVTTSNVTPTSIFVKALALNSIATFRLSIIVIRPALGTVLGKFVREYVVSCSSLGVATVQQELAPSVDYKTDSHLNVTIGTLAQSVQVFVTGLSATLDWYGHVEYLLS